MYITVAVAFKLTHDDGIFFPLNSTMLFKFASESLIISLFSCLVFDLIFILHFHLF